MSSTSQFIISICFFSTLLSCMEVKKEYTGFDSYPLVLNKDLWLGYSPEHTEFKLWSPVAEQVQLKFYEKGFGGDPIDIHPLSEDDGLWSVRIEGDLNGTYYTYQVRIDGVWLDETPGIYAKAVGVNGDRAMVLDMSTTDPEGWAEDHGPSLTYPNEAIVYELHIRDMTIHAESGSSMPGKYLGLVESGTIGPSGVSTGLDHIKELGITHVHLLPTYDHYSIDEAKLDSAQFNWGYDPKNYNVPEGSFSSDPFRAEVRIKEFKSMVKSFHDLGIGVILDVVYNHTGRTENSNFNLELPGYYYRNWEDGKLSDASACGNETASDREMMQKYILESVTYWAEEYHLDGFRFDLMGIHDTETMNKVANRLNEINSSIFVYGEGWTAGDSPLPVEKRALKKNIPMMENITAFSDDIRDGLKGSVFDDQSTGFVSGAENMEESVKFGVVGSIQHPQVDYTKVNYSDAPWTNKPWQAISYVSCHDNHTLYDKLKVSRRDASKEEHIAMSKLANAIVLTSQGMSFLHAGAELLRTKQEEHNSYQSPDSINQINWNWKVEHADLMKYYQNLIRLRKAHPAFRMSSADEVRSSLEFKTVEHQLLSYQISNYANNDSWKNIYVIYNSSPSPIDYLLDGKWHIAVVGDEFNFEESSTTSELKIPSLSMAILFQKG